MKIRSAVAALALSASVLAGAPAILAPTAAFAVDCGTDCYQPIEIGPSSNGLSDLSEGLVGDAQFDGVQEVVITATPQAEDDPGYDAQATYALNNSPLPWLSGSAPTNQVNALWKSPTFHRTQNCTINNYDGSVTVTTTVNYDVEWQTQGSFSANAASVLGYQFGHQLNTKVTQSFQLSVVIGPHQGFGLSVEYQTVLYEIKSSNPNVKDETVLVTQPTGNVNPTNC